MQDKLQCELLVAWNLKCKGQQGYTWLPLILNAAQNLLPNKQASLLAKPLKTTKGYLFHNHAAIQTREISVLRWSCQIFVYAGTMDN